MSAKKATTKKTAVKKPAKKTVTAKKPATKVSKKPAKKSAKKANPVVKRVAEQETVPTVVVSPFVDASGVVTVRHVKDDLIN